MAHTTGKTWTAADALTASDMNTYVRDNDAYNFSGRPLAAIVRNNGSDYTTTSGTLVDIDATNLASTLTLNSGRVIVAFWGTFYINTSSADLSLAIVMDGTEKGRSVVYLGANKIQAGLTFPITGISVGSHTFKVQWAIGANTAHLVSDSTGQAFFTVLEI